MANSTLIRLRNKLKDQNYIIGLIKQSTVDSKSEVENYVYDRIKEHGYKDVYEAYTPKTQYPVRRKENGGLIDTDSHYHMDTDDSMFDEVTFTIIGLPPKQHPNIHNGKDAGDLITWVQRGIYQGGAGARPFFDNTDAEMNTTGAKYIENVISLKVDEKLSDLIGVL